MNQVDRKRVQQVAHIVEIPHDYTLVVDDEKVNEDVHLLWWEKQGNPEEYIQACLRKETGELMELSIHKECVQKRLSVSEEQGKSIADAFLQQHAPHTYKECTIIYINERKKSIVFEYRQEVNGYSLPRTGFVVEVDVDGNVIKFRNEGIKEKPMWPSSIVEKESVTRQLKQRQSMEPVFTQLSNSLFEWEDGEIEEGYYLVYEPIPAHAFIEVHTGEDLHDRSHYVIETRELPALSEEPQLEANIERLFHIDKNVMKKVHEEERETEKIIILAKLPDKQESAEEYDKSFDAYWKKHFHMFQYETSITVKMDKETNELLGYYERGNHQGKPVLTREQCFEKALQFLGKVFPNYEQHLRVWSNQDDPDEEDPGHFNFYVYVNGVRIEGELVRVIVDGETGDIRTYSGTSQSLIQKLLTYDKEVKVSEEQALEQYCQSLRAELRWFEDVEQEPPQYQLVYRQTTAEYNGDYSDRREIRYIDASTGKAIWWKA
ncbi:YcdB/YcdC domain-containing protein [Bacillus sp. S13(2024)]|uniref:YcdB/YcdC domain-containing protein n=1 Tax=unclassified Bacillus (in: firmicutes) TaxID=185979 RepID=UPI003D1FBA52